MGFRTMFLQLIGRPTVEQLRETAERLRQKRMGDVLLVMARHYHEYPNNGSWPYWVIAHKLRQESAGMAPMTLVETLEQLTAQGLIQRLDGGDKQRPATAVDYIISDKGLNHVGPFDN